MCPIPNGFRDRSISLYSSKIVDKKELLRTVTYSGSEWRILMGPGLDDWIYWHFFTTTSNYNSSQSMTKTRFYSLLDYECLLFWVTDLDLIYESVTSSASDVRWLTLHSWTLNFLRPSDKCLIGLTQLSRFSSFYNFGRTKYNHHFLHLTLLHAYPLLREPCVNSVVTVWFHNSGFQAVFTESLPSKWLYSPQHWF
jgi:hypothetical protein